MRLHIREEDAGLAGVHHLRHEQWFTEVRCVRSHRYGTGADIVARFTAIWPNS